MPSRSREADVARAKAHVENRGPLSANSLTDPNTPSDKKAANAARLASALASAHSTEPELIPVAELYSPKLSAPETSTTPDPFEQELDKIFNPPYGSSEWIRSVEDLFSEPTTRVSYPAQPKSLIQKMKPIKPGRHAKEAAPGRFKKAWLALGAVASSLTVADSPFHQTPETVTPKAERKQRLFSKRSKNVKTRTEQSYSEHRRSNKNLRAIGAMAAAAVVLTGAIFATSGEDGDRYEPKRDAASSTYEDPTLRTATTLEEAVDEILTPENQVINEAQTLEDTETLETPVTFTISIESGGNIWDATRAELQKTNPSVTNQEVAHWVNRIIIENNLNTPDLVYAGNTFTVSN